MERDSTHRFVLDTNTIVSAFLFPSSNPGRALEFVLRSSRLLISLELAAELANVMRREKFDSFLNLARREELVAGLIRECEFIETSSKVTACRDVADNCVLELAVDGRASVIVSGDSDLLTLNPFHHIPILAPRDFLSRYADA